MKIEKIRKGDLVFYYNEVWDNKKYGYVKEEKIALVDGNEDDWFVIEKCISIHNVESIGSIIDIKDVFSIIKREDLEEWWNFI